MSNHNHPRPAIDLDEQAALRRSDPLLILFKLSAIIFTAEFLVMMALPKLTHHDGLLSWFLDAALLAVVSLPIVYLWFLKPLGRTGALRSLAVFGGVIFTSEVIVMGLRSFLHLQEGPLEALFDAALLTAICFSPIHLIIVRQRAAPRSDFGPAAAKRLTRLYVSALSLIAFVSIARSYSINTY